MYLLGCAPHNQVEAGEQTRVITEEGHYAKIDCNIDSDKRDTLFEDIHVQAFNFAEVSLMISI